MSDYFKEHETKLAQSEKRNRAAIARALTRPIKSNRAQTSLQVPLINTVRGYVLNSVTEQPTTSDIIFDRVMAAGYTGRPATIGSTLSGMATHGYFQRGDQSKYRYRNKQTYCLTEPGKTIQQFYQARLRKTQKLAA